MLRSSLTTLVVFVFGCGDGVLRVGDDSAPGVDGGAPAACTPAGTTPISVFERTYLEPYQLHVRGGELWLGARDTANNGNGVPTIFRATLARPEARVVEVDAPLTQGIQLGFVGERMHFATITRAGTTNERSRVVVRDLARGSNLVLGEGDAYDAVGSVVSDEGGLAWNASADGETAVALFVSDGASTPVRIGETESWRTPVLTASAVFAIAHASGADEPHRLVELPRAGGEGHTLATAGEVSSALWWNALAATPAEIVVLERRVGSSTFDADRLLGIPRSGGTARTIGVFPAVTWLAVADGVAYGAEDETASLVVLSVASGVIERVFLGTDRSARAIGTDEFNVYVAARRQSNLREPLIVFARTRSIP